jgi:hypothetical protein
MFPRYQLVEPIKHLMVWYQCINECEQMRYKLALRIELECYILEEEPIHAEGVAHRFNTEAELTSNRW